MDVVPEELEFVVGGLVDDAVVVGVGPEADGAVGELEEGGSFLDAALFVEVFERGVGVGGAFSESASEGGLGVGLFLFVGSFLCLRVLVEAEIVVVDDL